MSNNGGPGPASWRCSGPECCFKRSDRLQCIQVCILYYRIKNIFRVRAFIPNCLCDRAAQRAQPAALQGPGAGPAAGPAAAGFALPHQLRLGHRNRIRRAPKHALDVSGRGVWWSRQRSRNSRGSCNCFLSFFREPLFGVLAPQLKELGASIGLSVLCQQVEEKGIDHVRRYAGLLEGIDHIGFGCKGNHGHCLIEYVEHGR